MVLALAGIGSLFTGPGAAAAPYLFGTAFGTGIASAGLNARDRVDRDNFELLSAETALDALSLAGAPIGRAGKYVKFVAYTDVGAEVASTVILAREYADQIQNINSDPSLSAEEKAEKREQVYKLAVLHGGAMVLGHAGGNVAARVYQAGSAVRLDTTLPQGEVSVVHSSGKGTREIEVVYGEGASEVEIQIHSDVAKELAKNQGVYGIAYRKIIGEHNYKPGTRGEEVFFEVKKHEQLVSHYEAAVKGGETDLAPRLEQLRGSLERHNSELTAIRSNPDLANVPAHGQINVEALATGKRYEITTDMLERGGTHYGWGSKNAGSNARTFMKYLKEVPNSKIEVLKDGSIHCTGDTNGSSL